MLLDVASSYAVLIGTSAHSEDSGLQNLPAVQNNLADMREVLTDRQILGLPDDHIISVENPRNAAAVTRVIRDTGARPGISTFIVYYSGHGVPDDLSQLHLALPEASVEEVPASWLPFDWVRRSIRESVATTRVLILDCCYAGLAGPGRMSGSDPIAPQTNIAGTWTLYSSGETFPSWAPPGQRNTTFTGELLDVMRVGVPNGPADLDGDIIVGDLRRRLQKIGAPLPEQHNSEMGHRVALARNLAFADSALLPPQPPWRGASSSVKAGTYQFTRDEDQLINAALHLRKPLLVTGGPGTGKSSLAYSVAEKYGLGSVLRWRIHRHSTIRDGLYSYDEIGRREAASLRSAVDSESRELDIGSYICLGPLGTSLLPSDKPRVLVIDDLDKSDVDLPDDLLVVFEEGSFAIPELARLPENYNPISVATYDGERSLIRNGLVRCSSLPVVIITSSGQREFPPSFLRRCVLLSLRPPDMETIARIVEAHLGPEVPESARGIIAKFLERRDYGEFAVDQLLDAIYLGQSGALLANDSREQLITELLPYLDRSPG